MSVPKSERLLKLLIMLLVQRHYITKDRIRDLLYPDSTDEAFERMFDRDKDELRSLGVPIEVGSIDPLFDDELGYRIRPDEFALPDISLTADEASVVGLAARVWQTASLADATSEALRKLTAAGVDIDTSALDIAQPTVVADEPTFDAFWTAVQSRTVVTFDYRAASGQVSRRRLQPWGVTRYSGRWYVVGFDQDRSDERVFRLSRVEGRPSLIGKPGAYDVPAGTDVRDVARRLAPAPSGEAATVLVRPGSAAPLRRRATAIQAHAPGPDGSEWDRLTVPGASADEILAFGPVVYVEGPADLRDQVVARLEAVVQ